MRGNKMNDWIKEAERELGFSLSENIAVFDLGGK